MHKAYTVLTLKEFREEAGKGFFSGIASTPTVDRMGDIVEPKGAEFQLPIPLLSHHSPENPIGLITAARVKADGISVDGHVILGDDTTPATLKERLAVAWAEIKLGLVRGLSIGFQPTESARIEGTYSYRYLKWLWLELSAVTIPANAEANIQTIKSIAQRYEAAYGQKRIAPVRLITPPGVSGSKPAVKSGIPLITRGIQS